MKVAIVRGKFLNAYEMQSFEPLTKNYELTAFGSLTSYHDTFSFPTVKLPSPMDLPDFPYKMPLLNRLFVDAQYLFELENELKGFDIVHSAETYYHYTQQSLNAKKKGYVKKVVATVLENIPFNNEGILGRKKFKARSRKELDHIIALTNRTKESLLLEGTDEKKITVIGHGIDTKRFRPVRDFQKRLSSDKKKFTILFVGRLEAYKGVYEILYTVKSLVMDNELSKYQLQWVFVGAGSEKQRMIDMERRLGIEKFVRHREVSYKKTSSIYQDVDIFLAPSKADRYWLEQYNTALLEAQASGLPIVTTASGGIPENIGDAGVIVQPGDVISLRNAIKQFLLNPKLRIEYAMRSRKRAETVHDARIIARKIGNIYQKVINE